MIVGNLCGRNSIERAKGLLYEVVGFVQQPFRVYAKVL